MSETPMQLYATSKDYDLLWQLLLENHNSPFFAYGSKHQAPFIIESEQTATVILITFIGNNNNNNRMLTFEIPTSNADALRFIAPTSNADELRFIAVCGEEDVEFILPASLIPFHIHEGITNTTIQFQCGKFQVYETTSDNEYWKNYIKQHNWIGGAELKPYKVNLFNLRKKLNSKQWVLFEGQYYYHKEAIMKLINEFTAKRRQKNDSRNVNRKKKV